MSTVLLGETWPLDMPSSAKFVAISLADQANDSGVCWPAVGSIAVRTGFGERTIQDNLQWLESNRYLRREFRNGRSTLYHLTPAEFAPPQFPHLPPQQPHPTPAAAAPTPAVAAPITIKEPSLNLQGTIMVRQADRFPEFWKAYPKKVKKQEACKVWKSRKLDTKADEIIEDVKARQEEDGRWLGGFVPDPTTYLRGSRWEDEFSEPDRRASR